MKYIKLCIASLLLMSMSAFAQNGKFISNQYPLDNSTLSGSDRVNPKHVLYVDEVFPNINIALADGTTKIWSFPNATAYWAVMDRFVTGNRAGGQDFIYAQELNDPKKRRVGIAAIMTWGCTVSGANYTGNVKFINGATISFTNSNIAMCTGGD